MVAVLVRQVHISSQDLAWWTSNSEEEVWRILYWIIVQGIVHPMIREVVQDSCRRT